MKLSQLVSELVNVELQGAAEVQISGVIHDSRRARPGSLFVAVPGLRVDGHDFISDAISRGASAIVAQKDRFAALASPALPVPIVLVPDSRQALGLISAAFYAHPSRQLKLIGVTGTDGKTTTTFLIDAVLRAAGHRTGLVGTVAFRVGERLWDNELRRTTMDAPEIQRLLAEMVAQEVDYAVLETTSHALAQGRVVGCEYDVGVLTNVTRDHLDFHITIDNYRRAKARLFEMLSTAYDKGIPKAAVLNADDDAYEFFRACSPKTVLSYGVEGEADVMAQGLRLSAAGSIFTAVTPSGSIDIKLRLPGAFNVYNALAALGTGLTQEIPLDSIAAGLESVAGVPGRMERVDEGQPFAVIVDYAHTPDALTKVLATLRPLTRGKLMAVFGCMGDRDQGKRPIMGRIASELADFFILTNEDPASEEPEAIVDEIEAGAVAAGRVRGQHYLKIIDRREAIRTAFERARPGDVVLLSGKGHEHSMIVGEEQIPWDDRQVARELLREMGPF